MIIMRPFAARGDGHYLRSYIASSEYLLQATHNQFVAGLAPAFPAPLRVSFRPTAGSLAGPILVREPRA